MDLTDILLTLQLGLAVPWAGWVSVTLFKLNRDVGVSDARQDERLDDHDERLNALEALFPRQIRPTD